MYRVLGLLFGLLMSLVLLGILGVFFFFAAGSQSFGDSQPVIPAIDKLLSFAF